MALLIDGKHLRHDGAVVALGVDPEGKKHVLGLWHGATENATVVRDLLADLVDRGLDPSRPMLVVIDGAKALRKAVGEVFGTKCLRAALPHPQAAQRPGLSQGRAPATG